MNNSWHEAGKGAHGEGETTPTARLVNFLLARIAEDEVRAVAGPNSAHAEAKALRTLVEIHSHHDSEASADPCYTLRILAGRYQNHPELPPESIRAQR
ncbi:hypothetical protein [Kribbella sp. NPDC003557]|uniref:hypothetical protein n=1 Tax=Kribbella sp. NPDC003557 TaxID=3154449 RepID=UPI0033A68C86